MCCNYDFDIENNSNVVFYLLTEGLDDINKKILNELVYENGGSLSILTVKDDVVRHFPMPKNKEMSHISIATYYRLFVSMLLPKDVGKVIYLDCDIVVRGSLEDLWNVDIGSYALGVVYQHYDWAIKTNSFERLGIPYEFGYFNAGVLLMNLSYWREKNVLKRLLTFIEQNTGSIGNHDQDVLNAVLHKEVKAISCNWNMLGIFFSKKLDEMSFPKGIEYKRIVRDEIKGNPAVIHFVSRPKPWEYGCKHPFVKDYYYYLRFTIWKNWKPKFNFTNWYNMVFRPRIVFLYYKTFKSIKQ